MLGNLPMHPQSILLILVELTFVDEMQSSKASIIWFMIEGMIEEMRGIARVGFCGAVRRMRPRAQPLSWILQPLASDSTSPWILRNADRTSLLTSKNRRNVLQNMFRNWIHRLSIFILGLTDGLISSYEGGLSCNMNVIHKTTYYRMTDLLISGDEFQNPVEIL